MKKAVSIAIIVFMLVATQVGVFAANSYTAAKADKVPTIDGKVDNGVSGMKVQSSHSIRTTV